MPYIPDEQRRARLALRHALTPTARLDDMAEAARALVGIHSTDPTTVYLSTWARVDDVTKADIEIALYEDRSVVRVMGMRRTMFVVPVETAPLVIIGAARDLAARERRRLEKTLPAAGITSDPARWLRRVEEATMEVVRAKGEAVAIEIAQEVPELRKKVVLGTGKWAAEVGLSTRVLFILATEGMIVRARPRGTWVSSQYRWTPTDFWVPSSSPEPTTDEARVGLVRLYLGRFGPATETDVVWWTGWTKAATRQALAAVEAVEVDLDGGVGLALPDDLEPVGDAGTWVALLPSLDSTIMGWKQRDWYLGPHGPSLFDTNGNAGPTVWVDGRVVGGWAQSADGTVIYELVEDVGSRVRKAVAEKAGELSEWLEGKVLMPRFPGPLHRKLTVQ